VNNNLNCAVGFFLQWAEVLSADAFSAFEDAGLDDTEVSNAVKFVFKVLRGIISRLSRQN
jgi:Zn-dependent oligopeptidase